MRGNYQVYLYPSENGGYGFLKNRNKPGGRYFVSYETRKKTDNRPVKEREFINVNSMEEAKAERDRRYAELLLHGAQWKGKEPKRLRPKKKREKVEKLHPDDCLHKQWRKRIWWRVVVGKEDVGGSYSKVEARKIRDAYLRNEHLIKPCLHCGKRAEFNREGRKGYRLAHEVEGCPNCFELTHRDISKFRKIEVWNKYIRTGKLKPRKGLRIHQSEIEHLL